MEGGNFASNASARLGRGMNWPPQLGHLPPSRVSTQALQKVHSKLQIRASPLVGGRSTLQHSQLGRIWSIGGSFDGRH